MSKRSLCPKWSLAIVLSTVLGVVGMIVPAYAACPNPSPLPSGYAAPCPVWSASPASVSQTDTLTLSATPQVGTDYIYTTAYISQGTIWNPYTLQGNNAAANYSSALTSLTLTSSQLSALSLGTHYAVVWDWLWDTTAQCYKGPGLNQCNTGTWRVQGFTITATYTYSQSAYYVYSQSSYYAYAQATYYAYSQSAYYAYSQASYVTYTYSQSAYYAYSQGAYYAYSQSSYYTYSQAAYYAYSQSAYYSYSQSAYYTYSQSGYATYTYSQSAYTGSQTYTTNFPLTENPISEAGKWINGKAVGLDWKDVRTTGGTPGKAYGTETGSGGYDDSTAILTGSWGANQRACGTVYVTAATSSAGEEVEIRLRSSISAHSNTGYEINTRVLPGGAAQYTQIVRWNGPLGSYTYVNTDTGPGIKNGDVLCATAVGNTITAYINGMFVVSGTDSTYPTGSPGIGFYLGSVGPSPSDYGFSSFTASSSMP